MRAVVNVVMYTSQARRAGNRHRINMDSKFMTSFEDLKTLMRSRDQRGELELGHLVQALQQCQHYSIQYNNFLESIGESNECAVCLGVMGPSEELVKSADTDCGNYHVFHRKCVPKQVRQSGCPICCRPMQKVVSATIETPFTLHSHHDSSGKSSLDLAS